MASQRIRRRRPALFQRVTVVTLALAFLPLLLTPVVVQSIHLDIHVPLPPKGCLKYHALLSNRMLRRASSSQSSGGRHNATGGGGTEEVNLFVDHDPHVTLYLANFDLEAADKASSPKEANSLVGDAVPTVTSDLSSALNQTRLAEFKAAISSLNFTQILHSNGLQNCPLSLAKDPVSNSYYNINGAYTMLNIENTQCLRTLSNSILHSLQSFLTRPIIVPDWVTSLPEPARSAAIYRARTFGSPCVLEGFMPHVTVGYDPSITSPKFASLAIADWGEGDTTTGDEAHSQLIQLRGQTTTTDGDAPNMQWRIDTMKEWEQQYEHASATCIDEVEGIALGKTGVGGTVLTTSRMGYWDLGVKPSSH